MDLVPAPPDRGSTSALDLSEPFTPAAAARLGVGRTALDRMVRAGEITRLVRGVYVAATAELTPVVRARALGLVVSRRHLVVDRTAAWVHGAPALRPRPDAPIPLDLDGRRRFPGGRVHLGPGEITVLGGLRCTSPVRTAVDVARHLAPERALPLLDGLLRSGAITHQELIAASSRLSGLPGGARARELAAMADGRSFGVAESVLRLHWLNAHLPTPTPAWSAAGTRFALALPVHRFGVVVAGETPAIQRLPAIAAGWRVVALDGTKILASDSAALGGHLEREFHRHLLNQMA
jgi:hypothetical protein